MVVVVVVIAWLLLAALVLIGTSRQILIALWLEPSLKFPVLILESDDWGAGPLEQATQLERIAGVLASHVDRNGRSPVMTLGLVLGVASRKEVGSEGLRNYERKSLGDPDLAPVLAAICRGAENGVFALQLHGGEHYWPPALLTAAQRDARIADWLSVSGIPKTEELPAALQSRWTDSSELPSKPIATEQIKAVALAEAAEFRAIFGREPMVAVPPTFVWNESVEAAWAEAGVQVVVTPGRRYQARDAEGELCAAGPTIVNGVRSTTGVTYLVRDVYFEPVRGHKAEGALAGLASKTRLGRPTLIETHRANFLVDSAKAEAAFRELDRLLGLAVERFPGVTFLSSEELASRMRQDDPRLVEHALGARLHVWLRRLWQIGRLRKLAWMTGAIVPAWLVYAVTRHPAPV